MKNGRPLALLAPFAPGILVKTRAEGNANGAIGVLKGGPLWISLVQ